MKARIIQPHSSRPMPGIQPPASSPAPALWHPPSRQMLNVVHADICLSKPLSDQLAPNSVTIGALRMRDEQSVSTLALAMHSGNQLVLIGLDGFYSSESPTFGGRPRYVSARHNQTGQKYIFSLSPLHVSSHAAIFRSFEDSLKIHFLDPREHRSPSYRVGGGYLFIRPAKDGGIISAVGRSDAYGPGPHDIVEKSLNGLIIPLLSELIELSRRIHASGPLSSMPDFLTNILAANQKLLSND